MELWSPAKRGLKPAFVRVNQSSGKVKKKGLARAREPSRALLAERNAITGFQVNSIHVHPSAGDLDPGMPAGIQGVLEGLAVIQYRG